jgi:hypothetical protein
MKQKTKSGKALCTINIISDKEMLDKTKGRNPCFIDIFVNKNPLRFFVLIGTKKRESLISPNLFIILINSFFLTILC